MRDLREHADSLIPLTGVKPQHLCMRHAAWAAAAWIVALPPVERHGHAALRASLASRAHGMAHK